MIEGSFRLYSKQVPYVSTTLRLAVFSLCPASVASPDFQPWSAGLGSVAHRGWPPAWSPRKRGFTHSATFRRASATIDPNPWSTTQVWKSPLAPPGVFADTGFLSLLQR